MSLDQKAFQANPNLNSLTEQSQVKTGLDVIAVKKSETEGREFEPQEEGGLLPSHKNSDH